MAVSGYDRALLAWCRYYVETENFDRSISRVRSPRTGDAVVCHDPDIRRQSYANAREAQKRLDAALYGIDPFDRKDAKDRAGGWRHEVRQEYIASIERLTVVAPDLELKTANCKDAE